MDQKVIITDSAAEVNELIEEGWSVINITSQNVSTSAGYIRGNFCFLLERELQDKN